QKPGIRLTARLHRLSEQHCAKCGVSFVWFLIFLIGICLSLFILFNFLSQGAQSGYTHAYRL
ncbi:hypothetical protein, partial [Pseudomonas syringae]|uniref:hypothetical protein n=1 Tax=Pseudomonas syringae TaxID=317 RepID=UPI001C126943